VKPLSATARVATAVEAWRYDSDLPHRQAMLNRVLAVLQRTLSQQQQQRCDVSALAQQLELNLYSLAASLRMYSAAVPNQLMLEQLELHQLVAQLEAQQRQQQQREELAAVLEQQRLAEQWQQQRQQQQQQQPRAEEAWAVAERQQAVLVQQLREQVLAHSVAPLPVDLSFTPVVGYWRDESDARQRQHVLNSFISCLAERDPGSAMSQEQWLSGVHEIAQRLEHRRYTTVASYQFYTWLENVS
jgi:hypothetical protein